MPRQRLGVALLIPAPVASEVDALRRAVGEPDVHRVPAHITLVPPVNVREDDVDAAVAVVQAAAARTPPLRLGLGPVTTFAPVSPTLHLAVDGDLEQLRRLRDAVFVPPLERTLTHDFVPHVTLVEQSERIDAALTALAGYTAEVVLTSVHVLRETHDDDTGRRWRPIADARLGGRPAVIGRGGLELELTTTGALPPVARRWLDERWTDNQVERFGEATPPYEPLAVVARRDGQIVATAEGDTRATGEAYLAELLVAPDLRGEGVGAHVLAAFASAAAERGSTYLTLRTDADGRARAFYERLGFTAWYSMPQWRGGRDFVQLRREL
jgi:2'-5' RNA ligase/ribosomal protein S18 acetylase RimI-like enzyme